MLVLNIAQQYAKLGMQPTLPVLELQTTPPKLEITTQAATVEIRQSHGHFEIDQTPCRASIGLKNLADFGRDNAELGRQAALERIGREAEEGDRMAHIESGEDAIVNMAIESNYPEGPDITWAWIDSPIIRYVVSPPEFQPVDGKINYRFQPGSVQGDFRPGQVNAYMIQYQSIRMWTTENKMDTSA